MPVLLGAACAARAVELNSSVLACILAGAISIQIGTNFANDYADFKSGADTAQRLGPTRVTQAGLLRPRAVKWGANLMFALALVCGVPLMIIGGWPIVTIGAASLICGWAYTSGPYPLGYHGLGELFVILFFGFAAVLGTVYLLTGEWSALGAVVAVVPACHASALLAANNLRDLDTDRLAGKHTLAVRFGRGFARAEFAALMLVPFIVPLVLYANGLSAWILLPLLTVPLGWRGVRIAWTAEHGRDVIPAFKYTALLLTTFGVLFTIGLIAG